MANFRAKFYVTGVSEKDQYGNVNLTFHTLYDDTIPEDQRFALATPSGQLTMIVTNPVVLDQVKQGKSYYLDFIEV
jgi:hypothetical protein